MSGIRRPSNWVRLYAGCQHRLSHSRWSDELGITLPEMVFGYSGLAIRNESLGFSLIFDAYGESEPVTSPALLAQYAYHLSITFTITKPGRFGPSPLSRTVLWRRCKHARKLLAIRSRPPRSGSCGQCQRSVASRLRTVPHPPRLFAPGRCRTAGSAPSDRWLASDRSRGPLVRPRHSIKAIKAYDWTYSSPFQGTLVLAERSPVRPPAPRWRTTRCTYSEGVPIA